MCESSIYTSPRLILNVRKIYLPCHLDPAVAAGPDQRARVAVPCPWCSYFLLEPLALQPLVVNRRRPEGTLPFSSRHRHRSLPGLASHIVGRGGLVNNNDGWELAIHS